jgi:hypothetical protein
MHQSGGRREDERDLKSSVVSSVKEEGELMKKSLLLPIAFLAVATLSVRFSSADSGEASCQGRNCAEDSQPCCCQKSKSTAQPEAENDPSDGDTGKLGRGQGGKGRGMGHGPGRGMGHGAGHGPAMMGKGANAMGGMREDMTTLHAMFGDRDKIRRKITNLPDGAEAITESDDEAIAALLREHVPAMEDRVVGNAPLPPMTFHPIFIELIKNADKYALTYEDTAKGIKVKYASDDPYVVMLVQEHAKLVSRFIKNGMEEIHKPYVLPQVVDETTK